jgi:transcriptional regulator with XRE-family HTH domain
MNSNEIRKVMRMPPRLGEVIKQARQARRLTLRGLADQVSKEDGTPISPQYLFDIEVHHRVPAPHVLRELARVLALEYDTLLALAGSADTVVREYLEAHPQHTAAVIQLFRAAQEQGFEEWDRLRQIIAKDVKAAH